MQESIMRRLRRAWAGASRAVALGLMIGMGAFGTRADAQPHNVLVFAAASLRNALDDVSNAWLQETGKRVTISYAGSNTLARQLEAGAPADIFLSADADWMNYLASKDLIRIETRDDLLGNSLVLIAPKDAQVRIEMRPGLDLAAVLGIGRLAMGNVDAVPAGKYGKAALEKLGAWNEVKDRIAQAESVRAALLLVSRGEAPLGIVYRTDAATDPQVKIVAEIPEGIHPAIVYPAALTKHTANPDAKAFLDFLRSTTARALFERQGFTVMNKQAGP